MRHKTSVIMRFGVLLALMGCSNGGGGSDATNAEAPKTRSEVDRSELPQVVGGGPGGTTSTQADDRKSRRQAIEREMLDLEGKLRTATKQDEENRNWNEMRRQKLARDIEKGKIALQHLEDEGKTNQVMLGKAALAILESTYETDTDSMKRDIDNADKVRDQIDKLKRQLIDLQD